MALCPWSMDIFGVQNQLCFIDQSNIESPQEETWHLMQTKAYETIIEATGIDKWKFCSQRWGSMLNPYFKKKNHAVYLQANSGFTFSFFSFTISFLSFTYSF